MMLSRRLTCWTRRLIGLHMIKRRRRSAANGCLSSDRGTERKQGASLWKRSQMSSSRAGARLLTAHSARNLSIATLSMTHDGASLVRLGDGLDLLRSKHNVSRRGQFLNRLDLGRSHDRSRDGLVRQDPSHSDLLSGSRSAFSSLSSEAPNSPAPCCNREPLRSSRWPR